MKTRKSLSVHDHELFADPITDRAAVIIIAHNHPTGNVTPSKDDNEITKKLKAAGETLGIKVLDHIISATRDITASWKITKFDK